MSGQDWHVRVLQGLLSKGKDQESRRRDGAPSGSDLMLRLGSQGNKSQPHSGLPREGGGVEQQRHTQGRAEEAPLRMEYRYWDPPQKAASGPQS